MRQQARTTLKLLGVGFLALIMLIPLGMVSGLVGERQSRRAEAHTEIERRWGGEQTVSGPMIVVTERHTRTDEKGETRVFYQRVVELPSQLEIDVELETEVRYLGIYEMPVYTAVLNMSGRLGGEGWRERGDITAAHILVPISDTRALRDAGELSLGEDRYSFGPGGSVYAGVQGIAAPLPIERLRLSQPFRLELKLAGSEALYFLPTGKDTSVTMRSEWASPSFVGQYVPLSRDVNDTGFVANWRISELNRSYSQTWRGEPPHELMASRFGTRLYLPGNVYQRTDRAIKYGILFIGLTFLGFFVFEVLAKIRLHPVQYLFVGLALATFYLLLLALSEHIRFGWSYLIAAVALVCMVGGYCTSILRSRRRGLAVGGLLAGVYALLFWLILDENYSLLIGAVTILALLAVIMFSTRRVDWYAFETRSGDAATA